MTDDRAEEGWRREELEWHIRVHWLSICNCIITASVVLNTKLARAW